MELDQKGIGYQLSRIGEPGTGIGHRYTASEKAVPAMTRFPS